MLLQLGSTLLILLTTASFAVRKGLYRSTVMFFCCVIGAVVAFSYYENVYALISVPFLQFYGEGIPLFLLFLITVLILDLLSEQFLKGTMRLPVLIDRIGGGFVGFWTAMIAIGVFCIALQMMPWSGDVLGFERIYRDENRNERFRHLLFRPDEFTVSMTGYLLDNIFSGSQSYRSMHPDLLRVVAQAQQAVQAESRRVVPPDSEGAPLFDVIKLMQIEDPKLPYARLRKGKDNKVETFVTETGVREPNEGDQFIVARCKLRSEAADEDKWHRFTPRQVRIVGQDPMGRPKQYFAVGYREPGRMQMLGLASPDQPIMFSARGEYVFDLIFEVPEDFKPKFVEFKRLARAEVRGDKIPPTPTTQILAGLKAVPITDTAGGKPAGMPADIMLKLKDKIPGQPGVPPAAQPPAKPTQPPPRPAQPPAKPAVPAPPAGKPSAAAGRVGGRLVQDVVFGPQLPYKLSRKELADQQSELEGAALKAGHVVVAAADARGDPADLVTSFQVSPDVRLLQLVCDALQAKSLFGKAMASAVKTVGQYIVQDDRGRQYLPIGEYRIAIVGGQRLLELQYDAEGEPGRSIRPPKKINEVQLQEGSTVVLLYHVQPGAHVVKFTAGPHALANAELDATAPN